MGRISQVCVFLLLSVLCVNCTRSLSVAQTQTTQSITIAEVKAKWHTQFSIGFNESTKIIFGRKTEGIWWYDLEAGAEVMDRRDGNGDRYCGSIHPFTSTPCRHLVVGGKRYLLFPELQECCMCCTAQQGCGLLSPHWLDDAEFMGEVDVRGVAAYKWGKRGLQPNYWYASADDAQVPLQMDQMPNDLTSFYPDTFSLRPVDPSLLEVPPDCRPRCPLVSMCTALNPPGQGGEDKQGDEGEVRAALGRAPDAGGSEGGDVDEVGGSRCVGSRQGPFRQGWQLGA